MVSAIYKMDNSPGNIVGPHAAANANSLLDLSVSHEAFFQTLFLIVSSSGTERCLWWWGDYSCLEIKNSLVQSAFGPISLWPHLSVKGIRGRSCSSHTVLFNVTAIGQLLKRFWLNSLPCIKPIKDHSVQYLRLQSFYYCHAQHLYLSNVCFCPAKTPNLLKINK